MIVINLYGGPGCGKSTNAAEIFAAMKRTGENCELVTEFAKDVTWDKANHILSNQLYVFANQYHRLWRCKQSGVDVVVTDCPILLSLGYQKYYSNSGLSVQQAISSYNEFDNLNFKLARNKPYTTVGRNESEEEAKSMDVFLIKEIQKHVDLNLIDLTCGHTNCVLQKLEEFKNEA